jgi:hypothetical protein
VSTTPRESKYYRKRITALPALAQAQIDEELRRIQHALGVIDKFRRALGDEVESLPDLSEHLSDFGNPHQVRHEQLVDRGLYEHSSIDAHINDVDGNPHKVVHSDLLDIVADADAWDTASDEQWDAGGDDEWNAVIGTNSHQEIDAHIADAAIHESVPDLMPLAEAQAGIATTERVLSAEVLKAAVEEHVPISDWIAYTPAWTADTTNPSIGNGSIEGWYRQVGDTLYVRVQLEFGSTTSAGAGVYFFDLPTGFEIDTAKISLSSSVVGIGTITNTGVRVTPIFVTAKIATDRFALIDGVGDDVTGADPVALGDTDTIDFTASVPVE